MNARQRVQAAQADAARLEDAALLEAIAKHENALALLKGKRGPFRDLVQAVADAYEAEATRRGIAARGQEHRS